jgi:hypothetical protein
LSVTSAPKPASTPPPAEANLRGKVIEGRNGNGILDGSESALEGVRILLRDSAGNEYQTTTKDDGHFELLGLPTGGYVLYIDPPRKYAEKDFRYWTDSPSNLNMIEWQGELRGHDLELKSDTNLNLECIVGQLTLPLRRGTPFRMIRERDKSITFEVEYGTPVVAAAPGTVVLQGTDITAIAHADSYHGNISTVYRHLMETVWVTGDKVARGQIVGRSGKIGRSYQFEFELRIGLYHSLYSIGSVIDPYRTKSPTSRCYWTKDNDPQYP